jgi:hypothetical protein
VAAGRVGDGEALARTVGGAVEVEVTVGAVAVGTGVRDGRLGEVTIVLVGVADTDRTSAGVVATGPAHASNKKVHPNNTIARLIPFFDSRSSLGFCVKDDAQEDFHRLATNNTIACWCHRNITEMY